MNDHQKSVHQKLDKLSSQLDQLKSAIDERDEFIRSKINVWLDGMREEWLDRLMEMLKNEDDEWWKDGPPEFDE